MVSVLAVLQKMRASQGIQTGNALRTKLIEALKAQGERTLGLTDEIEFSEEMVDDYDAVSAEDIDNLFKVLQSVPQITHLSFNSFVMNEPMMQAIAQGIKTNTTLDSLDFSNTDDITDTGFSSVIEAIEMNNFVKKLNFSNNKTNAGVNVHKILSLLQRKPNIEFLDLSHMDLAETEVSKIANQLESNTHLKYLNLSGNYIDFIHTFWIARSLLQNKTLQILDMSGNRFNTQSLIELVKNFIARPVSVKLIIGGQHVTVDALNALSELICSNRSRLISPTLLEFVELDPTSAQAFVKLKKAFKMQAQYMSEIKSEKALQFSESQFKSKPSITESTDLAYTTQKGTALRPSPKAQSVNTKADEQLCQPQPKNDLLFQYPLTKYMIAGVGITLATVATSIYLKKYKLL